MPSSRPPQVPKDLTIDFGFESLAPPMARPRSDPRASSDGRTSIEVTEEDVLSDPAAVVTRLESRDDVDLLPLDDDDIIEIRPSPRAEPEPAGSDRRRGVRYGTVVHVSVPQGPIELHCRGLEISSSGIVLDWGRRSTSHPELLKLRIRLPDHEVPLEITARSVWQRGSLQGLEFVLPSSDERLAVAEAIDALRRAGLLY